MKLSGLVAVSLACAAGWLGADDDPCIRQSRLCGGDGPAKSVVVVNGHALFGGRTLRVADLSDPLAPTVVHEIRFDDPRSDPRFDDPIADLAIHGNRVFVVESSNEMVVIDAANPAQATIAGSYVPSSSWRGLSRVAVSGDLGVVGGSVTSGATSRIYFLDLTDAEPVPRELGFIDIDGSLRSLALGDSVAVASTTASELWFIDAEDPSSPSVAAVVDAAELLISGTIVDLAARPGVLAITDSDGRLLMVDLSDPTDPELVALIRALGIGVATVEFEGSLLHATGSSCAVSGGCGGYALIDAVRPNRPMMLGSFEGTDLFRAAPVAGYVAAAAGAAGLRMVELGDPAAPKLTDAVLPSRTAGVIASAGGLMHVVDTTDLSPQGQPERHTLRVLERSPDGSLSEAGSLALQGRAWALAADDIAVAAAVYDEENGIALLDVIDVADPTAPVVGTRLGAAISFEEATSAPHLAVHGRGLYFSLDGSDRILIYEIRQGGRAIQVGDYVPGGELASFAVPSDELMVVAVGQGDTGWVEVVDIGDPGASSLVGVFEPPEPAELPLSLAAEASRVLVLVEAFDGFIGWYRYGTLVSIADPSAPTLVMNDLFAGWWIAIGHGIYHTVWQNTSPVTPPEHRAVDVSEPPNAVSIEGLGYFDELRDRVDVDGPYLCISRGRLEVHNFGPCRPLPASRTWPAYDD